MVILREKGRGRSLRNLLIRAASYDTARTHNVIPIHQIKRLQREINRRRMVSINHTPGGEYGYRMNPESSLGIYTTVVKEAQ